MEKAGITHDDNSSKSQTSASQSHQEDKQTTLESGGAFVEDRARSRRLVRKLDRHILPLCAWIYLLNYLDRGNIGNSKVLNEETGDDLLTQTRMTTSGYAVAVSLFSLAYFLFEVPSNWIMKRYVRPSIWLGTLLGCWGLFTIGFAGVQNYHTVVVLRFFIGMLIDDRAWRDSSRADVGIGVFEAGFFPGIVYLISFWYPVEERSVRIAVVLASATASGAFGGCIAYGVGFLNGSGGLEGFRWLFVGLSA